MSLGWECPVCHVGNAPSVESCGNCRMANGPRVTFNVCGACGKAPCEGSMTDCPSFTKTVADNYTLPGEPILITRLITRFLVGFGDGAR